MKKIFYLLAIFASATVFSQQSAKQPLVIIDGMLASNTLINNDKKNIQSMDVYKATANIPQNLKNFQGLAPNGLIMVKVKENYYDKVSLKALNADFKLAENNPVSFDGNLITNTDLIVLGNVLEHMEVNVVNGQKVLSISTTPKTTSASALK